MTTTKDTIERAHAWAKRSADDHERAHHMLDADADQYSEEADDAREDGDEVEVKRMQRNAALCCAARDALDAVPALVAEIDALRAEAERQTVKYRALAALVSRMIRYAREDEMRTPGSTRLARALAEAERVIAPDVGVPHV